MKNKLEIWIHWTIVITTTWAIAIYFNGKPDILGSVGIQCFKYFTTDSNVLALIASLLWLVNRKNKKWISTFQFVSVVSVSITLLTVILFLVPVAIIKSGNPSILFKFYEGNVFVLHLSTPLLSLMAYIMDSQKMISRKETMWAITPVVVYSLIYLFMVVVFQQWKDWYGFTFGGHYGWIPIVMFIMYAFTVILSLCIWHIKKKIRNYK